MKRAARLIVIILVLILGSFYGYRYYYGTKSTSLKASGTIEATAIELNARNSGIIYRLPVEEGQYIKAGQLVAELSREDLLAQREKAAMTLQYYEAQLKDLQSGPRSQEVNEAKISVESARDALNKAETNLTRTKQLKDNNAISADELENAQLARDNAARQLDVASNALSLLQEGTRTQTIAAAAANVESARAALKVAESSVSDLQVYSPHAGTIISKNFEPGEYVPAAATLATMADLSDLWIKVYIPTDDLPRIKLGEKVSITVSGSDRAYQGEIINIASKGEYTPKMIQTQKERANVVFAVKIKLNYKGGELKPGMPADVVFSEN
ncbi:MAG: HlyD family secretion protein [Deltaproteobacteria bacterium]